MQQSRTTSDERVNRSGRPHTLRFWLAVFLTAFVVYALTANRGAQWQDSGHHILRIVTGESVNPLGLALSHPLHHWLGRLLVALTPVGPCFVVTLISSLAGAVAVANTFGCVSALTRNRFASLLAAASLGVAHTFWQMATVAETYTLTAALLSAECWCLVSYANSRRPVHLLLMCLFNGLGVANHNLAMLTTPVIAIVAIHAMLGKRVGMRHAVGAVVLWLIGSVPYASMVVIELFRTGQIGDVLRSALFGHAYADEVLNIVPSLRALVVSAGFLLLSFPNLLFPAATYGIARSARYGIPAVARRALAAGLVIHLCFVMRYDIVDQHTFFVPMYVLLAIFGGVGFAVMLRDGSGRARRIGLAAALLLLILTPVVYAFVPSFARRFDVLRSVTHNKPYRDDCVYLFAPWSVVETSADRMGRQAVDLAGEDGLILVEDRMAEFAIRYHAIRTDGRSVRNTDDITSESILEAVNSGKTIVLVPADRDSPRTVAPVGSWERKGDLYQLHVDTSRP